MGRAESISKDIGKEKNKLKKKKNMEIGKEFLGLT